MPLPSSRRIAGLALSWLTWSVASAAAAAAAPIPPAAECRLQLVEPEKYTDVRELRDLPHTLQQPLSALLQRLCTQYLPAGQTLDLDLIDVDLAGEVEPVGPLMQPVRILRAATPPRLRLRFTLRDAAGQIMSLGEAQLTDLDYLHHAGVASREGQLPSEQALLTDWFIQTWAPAAR